MNRVIKNSEGLPSWLDSLAGACGKAFSTVTAEDNQADEQVEQVIADQPEEQQENADAAVVAETADTQEVTAEVNVQNLPTVSWKDETFYVDFTTSGATLYNSFGNIVQELDGAKDIDTVNQQLNAHAVVADVVKSEEAPADDAFAKELARVMAQPSETVTAAEEQCADGDCGEQCQCSEKCQCSDEDLVNQDALQRATKAADVDLDQLSKLCTAMQEQGITIEQLGCSLANISKVIADMDEMKKMITALTAQQYAYTTEQPAPGSLDLGSEEAEVAHFQEMAEDTQKLIDAQNAVDISTQAGRAQLNYDFLDRIFGESLDDETRAEIIDAVESQLPPVEEPVAEEPAAEEPAAESVADIPVAEAPAAEETEEAPVEEAPAEDVLNDGDDVLSDEQAQHFTQRTCPLCGKEESLELEKELGEDDETAYIHCTQCGQKYVVETETGVIRTVKNEEE